MKQQLKLFAPLLLGLVLQMPIVYAQAPAPTQPSNPRIAPVHSDTSAYGKYPGDSSADERHPWNKANANYALVSAGIIMGITRGEFNKVSNGDVGGGLGLTIMLNPVGTRGHDKRPVNFYFGGTFEYLYFGGQSETIKFDDPRPYDAITNEVTTRVNINVYSFMFSSRVEFFNRVIVPFVEVAAGARWIDGKQRVDISRTQKEGSSLPAGVTFTPVNDSKSQNLQADFTATYGYGGGIRIGNGPIRLELKVMNMQGTTARYIDDESIHIDANTQQITYTTLKSTTDLLIPQVGVSLDF